MPSRQLAAERLPVAVLLLPTCFIVEVILGGPSGIYGGISVRLLLLGVSGAILVFALLLRGRVERSHLLPILSLVGFLILNGMWIAVVPVLAGMDMHWAVREPHAFIVLVLAVLILALLRREQLAQAVPRLQRVVVVTSLVLAVFQVGLWLLGTLLGDLQWVVSFALKSAYAGASEQLYVGPVADGFFRVFWISTLWCVLGFFWLPVALPNSRFLGVFRGLLLLDLFVAYSRGIWVGMLVGLMAAFGARLAGQHRGRLPLRSAVIGAVGAMALVVFLGATGSLERGFSRFTSTTSREDRSIGERLEQAPYLLDLWKEHPLVGSGYGAYATRYIRAQESPYSYEHMPYALLAKLGVVGLLVSGLFFAGWAFTAWQVRLVAPAQVESFLGSCTALLIAEMTNPMVLNFVSMCIFACLLIQWAHIVSSPPRAELPYVR